jgi:hypothetical protein
VDDVAGLGQGHLLPAVDLLQPRQERGLADQRADAGRVARTAPTAPKRAVVGR